MSIAGCDYSRVLEEGIPEVSQVAFIECILDRSNVVRTAPTPAYFDPHEN